MRIPLCSVELAPFQHISDELIQVAVRINAWRDASCSHAGEAPQSSSPGWPKDGHRVLWDSERLACVWRCHIKHDGQRPDLEELARELGAWCHGRFNAFRGGRALSSS